MNHISDTGSASDAVAAGERILVLGVGNLLWADEGFGVRCIEALDAAYAFPERVTVMDGGTQGLYLLPHLQDADILILFDAVDYGLEPGTMRLVEDADVPSFLGAKKMSLHQTGFQEVLASAQLLGWEPKRILLIGVQPVELEDYGGGLRPAVAAQIAPALAAALDELARHGVEPEERGEPVSLMGSEALSRTRYETERPTAAEACRVGDPRVLDPRTPLAAPAAKG